MEIEHDKLNCEFDENGNHVYFKNNSPFSGIAYESNENGLRISETEFLDGYESGISKIWNDQKTLIFEANYRHGQKHGTSREWFTSNQLKKVEEYEFGTVVNSKEFDRSGTLVKSYDINEHPEALAHFLQWKEILTNKSKK